MTDDLAAITGQPFWKPCTICHTKGHTGYYDRRLGRHVNEPCDECDGVGYVRNTAPWVRHGHPGDGEGK